ncbi:MAG: hypothetical protein V7K48_30650 [Nostoc sp.]|uniref:hypothetical protein n=1 Tax=Nostoc sp. TaxID=1180 RepID=UPI002FF60A28
MEVAPVKYYMIAILPVRPNKPRDKVKVEKAVQEVERQILAPLRHSVGDVILDLAEFSVSNP